VPGVDRIGLIKCRGKPRGEVMPEIVAELRAWAAEVARNKDVYPTWKENCRVLNQAAKEIERLREEIKQLRSGFK